jgi:hypothetical protein
MAESLTAVPQNVSGRLVCVLLLQSSQALQNIHGRYFANGYLADPGKHVSLEPPKNPIAMRRRPILRERGFGGTGMSSGRKDVISTPTVVCYNFSSGFLLLISPRQVSHLTLARGGGSGSDVSPASNDSKSVTRQPSTAEFMSSAARSSRTRLRSGRSRMAALIHSAWMRAVHFTETTLSMMPDSAPSCRFKHHRPV